MTTSNDLWNLADSLGITLEIAHGAIKGNGVISRAFGPLTVPVPLKVVSSAMYEGGAALFCRSLGNLAFVAVAGYKDDSPVTVFVVDLALLDGPTDRILDRDISGPAEVQKKFASSTVRTFHKTAIDNVWVEA